MSEQANPEPEQVLSPEPTPDSLYDVAVEAWRNNLDAVEDDRLSHGGQSLRIYPTDDPRDSILIFPVMGHSSMTDGTFRMLRTIGSKREILDVMTTKDGKRIAISLGDSDIPGALVLWPATDEAIHRMLKAISEASPNRPLNRLAKSRLARFIGNTASR